jgi:class 3 adenylate cyclase
MLSPTTRQLLRDQPLPDIQVRDLRSLLLKDLDEPERIYQPPRRSRRITCCG